MGAESSETRKRILQAADALFYGEGIHAVGVDRIAAQAGVTKRTLYYHFKSKDELIAAYLEARDAAVQNWLVSAADRAKGSIADQVAAIFAALARWGRSPEGKGCPFIRAAAEFPHLAAHPARAAAARHKAAFEAWLRDRIAAAGLAEPALRARQIVMLVDGAIAEMQIRGDGSYADDAGRAARLLLGEEPRKAEERS